MALPAFCCWCLNFFDFSYKDRCPEAGAAASLPTKRSFTMDKQRIEYLHQRYLEGKFSREEAADWEHVLHAEEYAGTIQRSDEHTSELQSLMRISYAVFCLKKKKQQKNQTRHSSH